MTKVWTLEKHREHSTKLRRKFPEEHREKCRKSMRESRKANQPMISARAFNLAVEYGMNPEDFKGQRS